MKNQGIREGIGVNDEWMKECVHGTESAGVGKTGGNQGSQDSQWGSHLFIHSRWWFLYSNKGKRREKKGFGGKDVKNESKGGKE